MNRAGGGRFHRRSLLFGGAAALAAPADLPGRADTVAVRQDAAKLAASPKLLAHLEAAIGAMQQCSDRDPHDPKGWRAHALDHRAVCAAVTNDDDAQVHGCWWFLPWHRAFLAVTEWKLRAIAGDPELALPYRIAGDCPQFPFGNRQECASQGGTTGIHAPAHHRHWSPPRRPRDGPEHARASPWVVRIRSEHCCIAAIAASRWASNFGEAASLAASWRTATVSARPGRSAGAASAAAPPTAASVGETARRRPGSSRGVPVLHDKRQTRCPRSYSTASAAHPERRGSAPALRCPDQRIARTTPA